MKPTQAAGWRIVMAYGVMAMASAANNVMKKHYRTASRRSISNNMAASTNEEMTMAATVTGKYWRPGVSNGNPMTYYQRLASIGNIEEKPNQRINDENNIIVSVLWRNVDSVWQYRLQ